MGKIFREFREKGVIVRLAETEKASYCSFLGYTWQDNLKASQFNLREFPRWSVISGYYAMHDLAKLFLAKSFGLKITERVHFATIIAMQETVKNGPVKKKAVRLLKESEKYCSEAELPNFLKVAKREREKAQYYTGKSPNFVNYRTNAGYFSENIVKPFVQVIDGLMEEKT